MVKWAGSEMEAPAPRNPAKSDLKTATSATIIPQNEDHRRFLFLIQAQGILDFLNQLDAAFETLQRADALGRDPGEPMSVPEALEMIYGADEL